MPPLQTNPRRLALAVLAIVAAAAAIAWLFWPRLQPLTPLERRLVGQWMRPDEPKAMLHTFAPNRRYAADNDFTGRWSITNGELHIKFWTKDPSHWYRRLAPDKDAIDMDIKFNDASDRIELGLPSSPDPVILQRKREL
jgi:hypothetical protein